MAKLAKIWDGSSWIEFISAIPTPYPDQTGNSSKVLYTDGEFPYWGSLPVVTGTPFNNPSSIVARDSEQSFDITAVDFDTLDTISSAVGRITWDSGDGTLSVGLKGGNVNLPIGQEEVVLAYNGTGSALSKGTVVYISGAQGQRPSISKASASSEGTSSKTLGLVSEPIDSGSEGFVTTFGILRGINTASFIQGSAVWLSTTAGNISQNPPSPPNHSVFIGYCVKSHSSSGEIFVKVQNGYELNELHNVLLSSVSDNQIISYDSSTSLWKNQDIADVIEDAGDIIISGNLTVNGVTTSVKSTSLIINDKNIELGAINDGNTTDITAEGGGIILLGDTDKSIQWTGTTNSWTFSENIDLVSGKVIKINGTTVLSSTEYIGNAASVTNGVYTNQSYSNPSWINSLAWSKITSTPTSLAGYGIVDVNATKQYLGLNNVENIGVSTWAGSTNITTLGTIISGVWNGGVIDKNYLDSDLAPLDSPTFIGNVMLPVTTTIGDISHTELSYLNNVTGNIQTQLDGKLSSSVASTTYAPINSPTFTTSATLPSNTSIGDVNSTEISYLDGVTSSIQSQLNSKAPLESPTFTGTVSGISKSMVGLGNVDNISDVNKPVSTAQQAALDLKSNLSGATFTGFVTLHADPTQSMHAVTKQYVDAVAEGLHIHASCATATTTNITALSSPPATIDGVTLTTGMRVLVKNQSTTSQNGIYTFNGTSLVRASDFDTASETNGGDFVFITGGTVNDNTGWVQTETVTTIGSDPILFTQFSGAGAVTAGTNISVSGTQVSTINNPTFSGIITASSGVAFSDGTQTKVGVPSISSFVSKTGSYVLDDLSLRDNIIEVNSSSPTTVTIPLDSSLNFPVGASLDVIQIGTGEVTIAAAVGVTVNSTPGLKLRTQWSSCTLLKRSANTWLVYGDLKA